MYALRTYFSLCFAPELLMSFLNIYYIAIHGLDTVYFLLYDYKWF
jgi:hypothetical protein